MGWYALEAIDEAIDDTYDLLTPFDLGTWLRLAVIVLFVGGSGSMNFPSMPSGSNYNTGPGYDSGSDSFGSTDGVSYSAIQSNPMTGLSTAGFGGGQTAIIVLAFLFILAVGLGFIYLSSVFQFIFYKSLIDEDVAIRSNFSRFTSEGLHYFGFRLAFGFLMVLSLAPLILLVMGSPAGSLAYLIAWLPFAIIASVFKGLTKDFVVLRMMESGSGVIGAWKSFWADASGELNELAAYILVKFGINIAAGILSFFGSMILLLAVGIPFGVLGFVFYTVSPVAGAIVALIAVIVWLFLSLVFIQVPVQTYLTYYVIRVYEMW